MQQHDVRAVLASSIVTLALMAPSGAFAYGNRDAISDCENRLRSEYSLSDFRHQRAEQVPGEGHKYKVTGETKVDGKKHPFECHIDNRHVTSVKYDGPEPEGMNTAQKLAVGAAAAIAAGLIASEVSKGNETAEHEQSPTGNYSTSEYDATTSLPCSLNKPTHNKHCAAGIHRGHSGSATIRITTPVGTERTLKFHGDDVTTPNGGRLDWGKDGGEWYIGIDDREFYIVTESDVYGG